MAKHTRKEIRQALDAASEFIKIESGGQYVDVLEMHKAVTLGYLKYGDPADGGPLTTAEIIYDHYGASGTAAYERLF